MAFRTTQALMWNDADYELSSDGFGDCFADAGLLALLLTIFDRWPRQ
jgi:hypothetical protein